MYDTDAHKRAAARELGGGFSAVVSLADYGLLCISCGFDTVRGGVCAGADCVGPERGMCNRFSTIFFFSFYLSR